MIGSKIVGGSFGFKVSGLKFRVSSVSSSGFEVFGFWVPVSSFGL